MKLPLLLLPLLALALPAFGDTIWNEKTIQYAKQTAEAKPARLFDPAQATNAAVRIDGETAATFGDVNRLMYDPDAGLPGGRSPASVAQRLADDFLLAREAKARGAASAEALVREGLSEPTEDELRAAWTALLAEDPSRGRVGETIEASHVLALVPQGASEEDKASALDKIKALRARILAGEDFAAVAREASDCPSKARGGVLGPFTRGVMVPAFEEAAFSQAVGVVGEPVRTEFGWHLILVTKHDPPRERQFEEVREELAERETRARIEKRRLELVEPLRSAATIEFDPEVDPAIERNRIPILDDSHLFLDHGCVRPPATPSPAEETHAESAEDAGPEPHAETAEGAK